MSLAKDAALAQMNTRIEEIYQTMSGPLPAEQTEVARLSGATNALIPLRKTIQEMTTWPFRDTVALGRAVLIASAPIIYTTLSELIRVFVIGADQPVAHSPFDTGWVERMASLIELATAIGDRA